MRGGAVMAARNAMKKKKNRRTSVRASTDNDDDEVVNPEAIDWALGCCSEVEKCGKYRWTHSIVANTFRIVSEHGVFNMFVTIVIFVAALLVGANTYPITDEASLIMLLALDEIVMGVFIAEIAVKLLAEGKQPWRYFFTCKSSVRKFVRETTSPCWTKCCKCCGTVVCCVDPTVPIHMVARESEKDKLIQPDWWNLFDFSIVAVGLMPFSGSMVTALRLIRLLRVLKLVRALPKLRILVLGLIKSLSSIVYIGLLLGLLFYLYAVLGTTIFGTNDPHHMGTLHIATLTLFRCATLEDWTDIMYIAWYGCANYGYGGHPDECVKSEAQPLLSVAYHCSFVVVSSMMILNLFIGVITASMNDAKNDLEEEMREKARDDPTQTAADPVDEIDMDVMKIFQEPGGLEELKQEIEAFAMRERQNHAELNTIDIDASKVMVALPGETLDFRAIKEDTGGDAAPGLFTKLAQRLVKWIMRSDYVDVVELRNGEKVVEGDVAPLMFYCTEEVVVTKVPPPLVEEAAGIVVAASTAAEEAAAAVVVGAAAAAAGD